MGAAKIKYRDGGPSNKVNIRGPIYGIYHV